VTQNFDCIFWCGDLNFRLSQPRDEVVQWVAEQRFPVPQPLTLQSDQLHNSRIEGKQEGICWLCKSLWFFNFLSVSSNFVY
jgi:hypothetical protein